MSGYEAMSKRLELRSITKRFGDLVALDDIGFSLQAGEIHAIVGENGAGKSTLVNVISGFVRPNQGSVTLGGAALPLGNPRAIRELGVAVVHQHFMLVPEMTVAENLALASGRALSASSAPHRDARAALDTAAKLGWELPPDAMTAQLSVGVRQRIEIVKALAQPFDVLLLDEPTAVLAPAEVEELFRVLKLLKEQGKTVAIIAHKISEVLAIADRLTVLRRGKVVVAEVPSFDIQPAQLAEWIVGEAPLPPLAVSEAQVGPSVLEVSHLVVRGDRGEEAVRGVDLTVRRGEILGIGGVDGNGQQELAEALVGIRPLEQGAVLRHYDDRAGEAYIPQDRQVDGLALMMPIQDNLLIGNTRRNDLTAGPLLHLGAIRRWADELVGRFGIKCRSPLDLAASLSGGNKQKVVVARNLSSPRPLVVAVNPTRGLDVKAAESVLGQLRRAAEGGAGVVLFSADLDELVATSLRVAILSRGKLLEFADAASVVGGAA